jgi:hypothetical protein
MSSYLSILEFKLLTVAPQEAVDDVETVQPGWVAAQIAAYSSRVDAQLRKRYAAPFTAPYPTQVQLWITSLVTEALMLRRGVDSQDAQYQSIQASAEQARVELKEAANSQDGLWDLPLSASQASAISKGGPKGYSEASPYVWTNVQAARAQTEDENGEGSYYG